MQAQVQQESSEMEAPEAATSPANKMIRRVISETEEEDDVPMLDSFTSSPTPLPQQQHPQDAAVPVPSTTTAVDHSLMPPMMIVTTHEDTTDNTSSILPLSASAMGSALVEPDAAPMSKNINNQDQQQQHEGREHHSSSAFDLSAHAVVVGGVPLAIHRSRDENELDASSSSLSEDDDVDDDDNADADEEAAHVNKNDQNNVKKGGLEAVLNKAAAAAGAVAAAAQDAIHGVGLLQTPPLPPGRPLTQQKNLSTESISSESMERTGSQNSSRDWGWFEDVHQSLHDLTSAAGSGGAGAGAGGGDGGNKHGSKSHHSSGETGAGGGGGVMSSNRHKKKRPLVPQVSGGEMGDYATQQNTDASAMAVTAPNYVLEESLSSQRLWKFTAGQRPPQPAEERAFYEKMWAQNFARSKVQYGMPVEVLTATSPISLNPFFDTNFSSAATDMVDYTNAAASGVDPTNPSDTATAVAEAALHSRMNNLMPADPDHRHDVGRHNHQNHSYHHSQSHSSDNNSSNNNNDTTAGVATPNTHVVNRRVHNADGDLIVLVKGDNVFGTTVSKSFARGPSTLGPIVGVDTVNISIASFRVIEQHRSKNCNNAKSSGYSSSGSNSSSGGAVGKYAQFLVIYREGAIRDTVGVWKRYSDFEELARKVTQAHEGCTAVIANMSPLSVTEEPETEHLPNAITSWRLLKKRQRWYRCLDAGYLSLKVFLLERFLHDILFESSSPKLLRDFVGAEAVYYS